MAAMATATARVDASGEVWGAGEGVSFGEALDTMTAWPAEADGQSGDRGRIEPGYLADFTVLPRDPRGLPSDEMAETAPVMTIVGGEVAWRGESFS